MKKLTERGPIWKTATCMMLSTFYFAMLAYPFGVTKDGYVAERAIIAGLIFFAISIPAWIINLKRELFDVAEEKTTVQVQTTLTRQKIDLGDLAIQNKWLSPAEVKQILYCQEQDGRKFGEVAVKRNFLTMNQVKSLLEIQQQSNGIVVPVAEKS